MKNLNEKRYWIWFTLIEQLGCIRKKMLLEIYKNPKEIYNKREKELLKIDGIGPETAKAIIDRKSVV